MNDQDLLERVQRWGGLADQRDAHIAIRATARALREGLFDDEAQALLPELPPELARTFARGSHQGSLTMQGFYERVAALENLLPAFAMEHAQAVCEALGSLLPAPSVARLTRALPKLASLFATIDRETHAQSHPPVHSSPAATLAEGHPGSGHPLCEAHHETDRSRGGG